MAEAEVLSSYEELKVVPGAAAVAGEVLVFNEMLGFIFVDITTTQVAANEERTFIVKAEKVKVVKNAGEVWTAGEFVYFDSANSRFTNVEGASTVLAGHVLEAALSAAVVGFIRFNGELANIRGNGEFVSGSSSVTGSLADVNTGLSLIQEAVASVKIATQGAGEAAYVTVDFGADGLLDLYCWDDAGLASTVQATVLWFAKGLK